MSYRNYQNKQNNDQNDDLLDDLYSRLSHQDRESEQDIASSLSRSIKSMSRKWLQEAYIDGMMLAEKLNRVTSSAKQNLDDLSQKGMEKVSNNSSNADNSNDGDSKIALIVRQELQKLGLVQSKPEPQSTGVNFAFGLILILSGFFVIGGAIGYYGLDTRISSFVSQNFASLTGNKAEPTQNLALNNPNPLPTPNANPATNSTVSSTLNTQTPTIAPTIAQAQDLESQLKAPEQSVPVMNPSANVAANAQGLTSNPTTPAQSSTTQANQQAPVNPASAKPLPASCNGKQPILNRPLNIQNTEDRAILYCILDLQAQAQQNQPAPAQTQSNPNSNLPTPNQAPQL